jgi:serine/threonine protein kinase
MNTSLIIDHRCSLLPPFQIFQPSETKQETLEETINREVNRIFKKFNENESQCVHKKTNFVLDLTKAELKELIVQGIESTYEKSRYLESPGLKRAFLVKLKFPKNTNRIKYNFKIVGQPIGQGTCAKINKVYSLKGKFYALKIPQTDGSCRDFAIKDVIRELNVFEKLAISPNKPIKGLVRAPYEIYLAPDGSKSALYPKYHADAYEWSIDNKENFSVDAFQDLTDEKKQQIVIQLLEGVRYLHSKDYGHGDLKPENFFVDGEGPDPHVRIGDFGGMINFRKNFKLPTFTKERCNYKDIEMMQMCINNTATIKIIRAAMFSFIVPAHDLFTLGVSLFMMFGNSMPYPFVLGDKDEYLDITQPLNSNILVFEGVNSKIIEVIHGLLRVEPNQRLSIKGALDILNSNTQ